MIANASHVLMKPMPKLKAPHAKAIQESQMAGPIFLMSMLLGSSKRMYPMKKICTTVRIWHSTNLSVWQFLRARLQKRGCRLSSRGHHQDQRCVRRRCWCGRSEQWYRALPVWAKDGSQSCEALDAPCADLRCGVARCRHRRPCSLTPLRAP